VGSMGCLLDGGRPAVAWCSKSTTTLPSDWFAVPACPLRSFAGLIDDDLRPPRYTMFVPAFVSCVAQGSRSSLVSCVTRPRYSAPACRSRCSRPWYAPDVTAEGRGRRPHPRGESRSAVVRRGGGVADEPTQGWVWSCPWALLRPRSEDPHDEAKPWRSCDRPPIDR